MIPYIAIHYAGCKYRSRTEARWAVFFDALGLRFQYEFEGLEIRSGAYLPDFWIPDLKLFMEIKGDEPTEMGRRKCAEVCEAAQCAMILAVGAPEERFQLLYFDAHGERENRYALARDRLIECGYWRVSEGEGVWLGPNRTFPPERPRGPMFSGALEEAYEAARSARFERGDGKVRHPLIVETGMEWRTA